MPITVLSAGQNVKCIRSYAWSFNVDNNSIGWTKMIEVFENRIKQVADEKFTDSAKPRWPISCADGSGWPLLFLEYLDRKNLQQVSTSSSSIVLCGLGHLSLAEES